MNKFSAVGGFCNAPSQSTSLDGSTKYCSFTISCGTEKKVCFVDCIAFGKMGELILQWKKKGDRIFVIGHFESVEKKDDGYRLVLILDQMEIVYEEK